MSNLSCSLSFEFTLQVQLFGLFGATILYELARFIIFHVVVVVYMIYGTLNINIKISIDFLKSFNS